MHTRGDVSTVVDIQSSDDPMNMPAIQPLLSDNADRVNNPWPFTPPSGDPSQITKADYRTLIMTSGACLATCLNLYAREDSNGQANWPDKDASTGVPILVAAWKGEPDAVEKQKYLRKAVIAVDNMCAGLINEFLSVSNPSLNYYWWGEFFAYTHYAIQHTYGTTEYDTMMSKLWKTLGQIVDAWPIMNFRGIVCDGAEMGTIAAAFWYDGAVKYQTTYNYQLANANKLLAFANNIWNEWVGNNETADDDPWYGTVALFILQAWCFPYPPTAWPNPLGPDLLSHGPAPIRDYYPAEGFWRHYADHIANDGTFPAYGDGGRPGLYFVALLCAELAASRATDNKGFYKRLAHRAFWNGRDRLLQLEGGSYINQVFTALAYLHADDSIPESGQSTGPAGVTLSKRQWRDLSTVELRLSAGRIFTFQNKQTPNKLIFRAGASPTDACMVMQVGQLGGHGHMDAGAITYYGSDHAYYFDYATLRLDKYQESSNIFTLRNYGTQDILWCGRVAQPPDLVDDPSLTTEEVLVPTMGNLSDGSYARIQIVEYLGCDVTRSGWWELVKQWNKAFTLEKAIGYKNWPMRLNRSVLFVNNKFTVVRDDPNFLLPVSAEMGPNWTFGEMGCLGTHWVNVWMPKVLNAAYGDVTFGPQNVVNHRTYISTAPKDLLIWFSPDPDSVLQIEKLKRDRTLSELYIPVDPSKYTSSNSYINLPMRAWYTRRMLQGIQKAFTTVLMPHDPMTLANLQALVNRIETVQDDDRTTALTITDDTYIYLIVMQSFSHGRARVAATLPISGKPINLEVDGETTLLTCNHDGTPVHASAWGASALTLNGTTYSPPPGTGSEWELNL